MPAVGNRYIGASDDIATWDRDPYAVPTAALDGMVCDLTLFRGNAIFERRRP